MAKNPRTPVKIEIAVGKAPVIKEVEPGTEQFAAELAAAVKKARRPVFLKKLRELKDEYMAVVLQNEADFTKQRIELEAKHTQIRLKNEKEFNEKVEVLKKAYL